MTLKKKPVKSTKKPNLEWSEARKHAFIVSVLRQGTRRWAPKYQTLAEAKTTKKVNRATKRVAQHYRCKLCRHEFPATGVEVDHVQPVVDPAKGFTTWDEYIERMFVDKEGFQVLCKPCHKIKTQQEKGERLSKLK